MRVLLTNDDGIGAPGLVALFRSVKRSLGDSVEIVVVAPDRGRSECGHSVTTGRPLRLQHVDQGWISVDGTPVDCVRAALHSLVSDIDMVLSGVNAGANLGVDLLVSGTFAAAREAAIAGVPAMAVSHYRRPDVAKTWEHVPDWLASTLTDFCDRAQQSKSDREHGLLWNVNLPAIDPQSPPPPRARCPIDRSAISRTARNVGEEIHLDYDFHGRARVAGSDVDRCFSGQLTITELHPHIA